MTNLILATISKSVKSIWLVVYISHAGSYVNGFVVSVNHFRLIVHEIATMVFTVLNEKHKMCQNLKICISCV